MSDLEQVSARNPGDPELLTVRGLVRTAMKDYDKAIDDLDQAVAKRATIETYIARGRAYQARNDTTHAASDFRQALALKPRSIFDAAAQASLKQKIEHLAKQVPCPGSSSSAGAGTCL